MGILLKIPVPWVFILFYMVGWLIQRIFPLFIYSLSSLRIITGVIFFLIGIITAAWCLFVFWQVRTTTIPGKKSKSLIKKGLYRFTRNPMYISLFLIYFGEALFLNQLWPVFMLPFIFVYLNWTVIPLEEITLQDDYKEEYNDYCKMVHRWF